MPNRDFRQFDFRSYQLVVSASQLMKFNDCNRQWWFEKVCRLPVPPIAAGPFGDATHDAIERWLLGDANGRGPDGKPIEMWPKGWDAGLTMTESALIKMLVDKAIEAGHIRRTPGRATEAAFQRDVAQGISIIGFADLIEPAAYEDHKTTKHFGYCETEESLGENIQMIVGAAEVITRAMEQGKPIDAVRIAHNYLAKEDPAVKKVEATLTTDFVKDKWLNVIVPLAQEMAALKRAKIAATDWDQVPKPRKKGVCKKYRGCPFQNVCGGTETPKTYTERMEFTAALCSTERSEKPMSNIFDKMKKKKAAAAAIVTEAPADVQDVEATVEDTAPETFEVDRAPWYSDDPDCVACQGNAVPGFNSAGEPCRACLSNTEITPTDFDQTVTDEGKLVLVNQDDGTTFVLPWIKRPEAKKEKPAKPPRKKAAQKDKPTDAKTARAAINDEEPPKKAGRPKKGFTLIYGIVKRGKRATLDLNQVLKDRGQELADANGAESYFQLDFGKRRDYLAIKAQEIAAEFGSADVIVTGLQDADVRAFATAIEPYADRVIVAG